MSCHTWQTTCDSLPLVVPLLIRHIMHSMQGVGEVQDELWLSILQNNLMVFLEQITSE